MENVLFENQSLMHDLRGERGLSNPPPLNFYLTRVIRLHPPSSLPDPGYLWLNEFKFLLMYLIAYLNWNAIINASSLGASAVKLIARWITDHYHPSSKLDVAISKGCFYFEFASLPSEVARPISPTTCTKVAVNHQSSCASLTCIPTANWCCCGTFWTFGRTVSGKQ